MKRTVAIYLILAAVAFCNQQAPAPGEEEIIPCPAVTVGELSFPSVDGGEISLVPCAGNSGLSYGRPCNTDGTWGDIIGYCMCGAFTDEVGIEWPATATGQTVTKPCISGHLGSSIRTCSSFGEWSDAESTCESLICKKEMLNGVEWPKTDASKEVHISCKGGDDAGYTRKCADNGIWANTVTGSCRCPLYVDEFNSIWPTTQPNTRSIKSCPAGLFGRVYRDCDAYDVWKDEVNECGELACLNEYYSESEWPRTLAGETSRILCPHSTSRYRTRACSDNGVWSETVGGDACTCQSTSVETLDEMTFFFPESIGGTTVTKSCSVAETAGDVAASSLTGTISYSCSLGGQWNNLRNDCEILMCSEDRKDGIYYAPTPINTSLHVECAGAEAADAPGYTRKCLSSGQWDTTVEGTCKCEASSVKYVDNIVYSFPRTAANDVVLKQCVNGFSGSLSRTCDALGNWKEISGTCNQLYCQETVDPVSSIKWPSTKSFSTVKQKCPNEFFSGELLRTCSETGAWNDVVDNCYETQCTGVTSEVVDDMEGCMDFKMAYPANKKYAHLRIVPAPSNDLTTGLISTNEVVRVCGMKSNVNYSVFIKYSNSNKVSEWSGACIISSLYYSQTCAEMDAVTLTTQVANEDNSRTLYFALTFPQCSTPQSYELSYQCVSNCGSADTSAQSVITLCDELNGCKMEETMNVSVTDEFAVGGVYSFSQRVLTGSNSTIVTPHSPAKQITIRNFSNPTEPKPTVAKMSVVTTMKSSSKVSIELSGADKLMYKYHVISLYRLSSENGVRLLEDALISEITLCNACTSSSCVDSCNELLIELSFNPKFQYKLLVQSFPIAGYIEMTQNSVVLTTSITPQFTLSVSPGDSFAILEFADGKMDLFGTCLLVNKDGTQVNDQQISVEYKPLTTHVDGLSLTVSDLAIRSRYVVSCSLFDASGVVTTQSKDIETLPIFPPTLSLNFVRETPSVVSLNVITKKPGQAYCSPLTYSATAPSPQQLLSSGQVFEIRNAMTENLIHVKLASPAALGDYYRVYCLATDVYQNAIMNSIIIHSAISSYVPTIVSSTPVANSKNNVPTMDFITIEYESAVVLSTCDFCFFMLTNNKNLPVVIITLPNIEVNENIMKITVNGLVSDVEYQLIGSIDGLVKDKVNSVSFIADPTTHYLTFATMDIASFAMHIVSPQVGIAFPVNGVIEFRVDAFVSLTDSGVLTLNEQQHVLHANDQCIELKHTSLTETIIRIPVSECMGVLNENTGYSLHVSEGFVVDANGLENTAFTQLFTTDSTPGPVEVISSYPPHSADLVPTDTMVKLYFNKQVMFGQGLVFLSDSDGNVINIPAFRATYGTTFPYEMSLIKRGEYTLNPSKKYTITWSEGAVLSLTNQPIAASTSATEIVFWSASSQCSPDYVAERARDTYVCKFEQDMCQCSSANVIALAKN